MRTLLTVLAVIVVTACGSTDEKYRSPFIGSMSVGGKGQRKGPGLDPGARKEYSLEDMQESADKINRRVQSR